MQTASSDAQTAEGYLYPNLFAAVFRHTPMTLNQDTIIPQKLHHRYTRHRFSRQICSIREPLSPISVFLHPITPFAKVYAIGGYDFRYAHRFF